MSGLGLVLHACVCQSAEWPPTLACASGIACHNQSDRDGAEPDVRDRRDGVRVAAAAGGDVSCRADHDRTRQCARSKVRPGAGTGPEPGHGVGIFACVLAQSQSDWALLEMGQAALSLWEILSDERRL